MEGVAVLEVVLRGVAVGVKGDADVLEVGRCPVLCTELETIKPGIAAGVGGFLRGNHVCVRDWAILIVDVVMW